MIINKTNIAFLTHGYRNLGGGEQSWYFLITKLNKTLFNPIVFVSKHNRIIEKIKQQNIPINKIHINKKITSIFRDQVKYNPIVIFQYIYFLSKASWNLFHLLRAHRIKILHVHDNLAKIIGVPAAKFLGVKIITNCNDQLGNALIDRLLLLFQKYFFDKVFCVSKFVGNTFSMNGRIPDHISINYSAIEPDKWVRQKIRNQNVSKISDINPSRLGIVAVFDGVKGHIYLFKAIKLLLQEGVDNFYCEVIGNGREKDNLHRWVSNNGIEKYIIFHGFVPNLIEILEELDILIVPSIQESFGMSAVEAMAMEIPVIASKVGGIPEVIEDGNTGILVPSADPRALANAIKYLINNPKLRLKMGGNGNKRVRKMFDINKNIRITEKIIWEMVNNDIYPDDKTEIVNKTLNMDI